ncbi:MAG: insulinase family protein [Magnetococcales bacterium]|nr:insulinase family protein [Magnetococcales bacterium]
MCRHDMYVMLILKKASYLAFFALFLLVNIAITQSVMAQGPTYREFQLDNGMKAVIFQDAKAPVAVVHVWYQVGAVDEQEGKTGVAHMLEHMMFQGTRDVAPGQFSKMIARLGGSDNASTSLDYTNYHSEIAVKHLDLVLKLEADRMRNLVLTEKEFISENKVVREERRTRTDTSPRTRFREQFSRLVHPGHPYGRPVIGWMKDIENHRVEDLQAWYRRFYAPNNAIVVVAGDVDLDDAQARIQHHFGALKADPTVVARIVPAEVLPEKQKRLEREDKDVKVASWQAVFLAPSLTGTESDRDVYALEVLSGVLSTGLTSRLQQNIVIRDKLALSAGAGYYGLARPKALGSFKIAATPRPEIELKILEAALFNELARFTTELVADQELQKIKNQLVADHIYGLDSIEQIAWSIGRLSVNDVRWQQEVIEYQSHIKAVTAEDLMRVAKKYLQPNRATVGILKPSSS